MAGDSALAPGVPANYYTSIYDAEQRHWWHVGMREIARVLLGGRLTRPGSRLLDAGCGTGGFLRWALDSGSFAFAGGVDIGSAAIELARTRVPEAELEVAPLRALPFEDGLFDLAVTNDVLQHVPEDELDASLGELRRVLAPGGALLVRTNGSRRLRRERADWRAYDAASLRRTLEDAGLGCERVTYANAVLSLVAAARRRAPHAPSETSHGIPAAEAGALRSAVGRRLLHAEARWLSRDGRRIPYGHTLFAVAVAR
jgi:SAM-dependent methyltransferase